MISELCVHDLGTGETAVVLRHEGFRVEAPNWWRDGLLVNGDGRLFHVPFAAPALVEVATGRAQGLNNDHGPAPDGGAVAVSAKAEAGASCIYVVEEGRATRVTALVPSWFHAWSPDGSRMAYASVRDGGPVAIRTCARDGSDEALVTDAFDHADGPDYAADGSIWFNGERDGAVDLWRVAADGSGLTRMTEGDSVDWFPHPSPDGSCVLYLFYPPGTQGHPADLDVALRLMPLAGGASREVVRLRGGQGTINVPAWAPDGRRFAFARYPMTGP